MKKILFLSIIILVLGGCKKFLDLAPISSANVGNFYKTQNDFENALIGAYSTLKKTGVYKDNIQLVGDLRSDNTEMGTTASDRFYYFQLSEFSDEVTNPIVESIWNDHYNGINDVNKILDNINNLDASSPARVRIEGESKFLRGLFYFNLVRVFGDVPLITNSLTSIEDSYSKGRETTTEVYKQITADLNDAKAALPDVASQSGRATKEAAAALLGKVYLTLHDYNNSKSQLEEVVNSKQYQLLNNYGDLWKVANKNSRESVFAVQFKRGAGTSTGSNFSERYTPYLYPYLPYYSTAGGYNIPTEDIINAYETGDLRKGASLKEYYVNPQGDTIKGLAGRYCSKFLDMPTQSQGSDDNWPVIRYADVLLMYAEVLNEISFVSNGPAFDYLNMIRKRAGLPDKTAGNPDPNLSIDSQNAFRLAIEQERRVELAFEGHRWFDLLRTGRAITVLQPKVSVNIQDYMLLLPIPQTQIDINPSKIKQNPGY
jgi:hypothetical protein